MATPNNIQRFNELASQLFSLLYEQFPTPADLEPNDLGITAEDETWQAEDYEFVDSTIDWLSTEGYIRVRTPYMGGWAGVTLTQKGLAVLRAVPDTVSGKEPLGDQIKDAVKSGAKATASSLVEQAFSLGVKYLHGTLS